MSRHSDEYNPMLDDYNDPEFNSYTSQGFKTTKSSKSGGLIDRAQNPTYELHISRIPIGNFFYIFLLFVLLFSKQVYKVSFVILTFVIDFTELGLQNIFGQYGTVVKTFLCRPKLVNLFKTNTYDKIENYGSSFKIGDRPTKQGPTRRRIFFYFQ